MVFMETDILDEGLILGIDLETLFRIGARILAGHMDRIRLGDYRNSERRHYMARYLDFPMGWNLWTTDELYERMAALRAERGHRDQVEFPDDDDGDDDSAAPVEDTTAEPEVVNIPDPGQLMEELGRLSEDVQRNHDVLLEQIDRGLDEVTRALGEPAEDRGEAEPGHDRGNSGESGENDEYQDASSVAAATLP